MLVSSSDDKPGWVAKFFEAGTGRTCATPATLGTGLGCDWIA